jgi:hypothetical protein
VRAEHLIAICLQTGRDKDRERVRILREQAELDMSYLASVLQRHGLEGEWKPWTPKEPEITKLSVAKERRRRKLARLPFREVACLY